LPSVQSIELGCQVTISLTGNTAFEDFQPCHRITEFPFLEAAFSKIS